MRRLSKVLSLIALAAVSGAASASAAVPTVGDTWATDVHTDRAAVHAEINASGEATAYHVEYGTEDCSLNPCTATSDLSAGSGSTSEAFEVKLTGLDPATTYYYRFSASNNSGPENGSVHTFTTFPYAPVLEDPCTNAHVRQQTSAALLADCRAYELVSAADTGGYDVESSLVPGQEPYGGYPDALGRALYGIHSGAIPGIPGSTNRGVDPYVATRGEDSWTTAYVGIPADNPFASAPFSSTLLEANAALDTFAFGGPKICDPCFSDGSTGLPLHLSNGELVQGMQGTTPQPTATDAGLVRKRFSADGNHFVFSSTSPFEPAGDAGGSIYDRNLSSDTTQVVSTQPSGATMTGGEVAELDISEDGSRIIVGKRISTDSAGNDYFHLYMHIGADPHSIDLTPGASAGALYSGMTADGSKAFLTTTDQLLPADDTDSSADIYEAAVDGAGVVTLRLISVEVDGTPSNDDGCEPVPNSHFDHWNSVAGSETCGAVAVGGGGGVGGESGAIYFLSPEALDTSDPENEPVPDAPNLYLAAPGSNPHFIATLESSLTGPPQTTTLVHSFDSFFGNPRFVVTDNSGGPSDGDVYVADIEENVVRKFDPDGNLITSWGESGVMSKGGSEVFEEIGGIAVRSNGTLYVQMRIDPLEYEEGIHQYKFAEDGTYLGFTNTEAGSRVGGGVVVDSAGFIYKPRPFTLFVTKIGPGGEYVNGLFGFDGEETFAIALNSADDSVYLARPTAIKRYGPGGELLGETPVAGSGVKAMAVDPGSGNLFLDEGNVIHEVTPAGTVVKSFGGGVLSGSNSIAVSSSGAIYATIGDGSVGIFKTGYAPDPRTDNPLVVDSVESAAARFSGDFQTTPTGDFAAFTSTIPLLGHDIARISQVYRYDEASADLGCASCSPTGARSAGVGQLATDGLSLSDDGRVFFNSDDALTARDLDNRRDVYQWDGGVPQLISTGASRFDASLLSAGSDGTDVFFFTRDALAPQDKNGSLVRLYDARAGGGFEFRPPPVSCKASDECHGPGSEPPGPLPINTIRGTTPTQPVKCHKGQVKKKGHCVNKRHRNHRRQRRSAHTNHGGHR